MFILITIIKIRANIDTHQPFPYCNLSSGRLNLKTCSANNYSYSCRDQAILVDRQEKLKDYFVYNDELGRRRSCNNFRLRCHRPGRRYNGATQTNSRCCCSE